MAAPEADSRGAGGQALEKTLRRVVPPPRFVPFVAQPLIDNNRDGVGRCSSRRLLNRRLVCLMLLAVVILYFNGFVLVLIAGPDRT